MATLRGCSNCWFLQENYAIIHSAWSSIWRKWLIIGIKTIISRLRSFKFQLFLYLLLKISKVYLWLGTLVWLRTFLFLYFDFVGWSQIFGLEYHIAIILSVSLFLNLSSILWEFQWGLLIRNCFDGLELRSIEPDPETCLS